MKEPVVLAESNHWIGIFKPAGWHTQGGSHGALSCLDWVRSYLKEKGGKLGNAFVGLVHRLDTPVSGVLVFAKTSKGASRLSEQIRERRVKKIYRAIVEGKMSSDAQSLEGFWVWDEEKDRAFIQSRGTARVSLRYRVLKKADGFSLLEIELLTGKKHQIRAFFSAAQHPILGDQRYGSKKRWEQEGIALLAHQFSFADPVKADMEVTLETPAALSPLTAFLKGQGMHT